MKKPLLVLSALIALTACNDSSSDVKEEVQETQEITVSLETNKVQLQFNLPASSEVLNTEEISLDDPLTYNASVSTYICEPSGEQALLHIYFLKREPQKWDVYYSLDDDLLDIDGGVIGGTGQNKATLEFDELGNFVRQVPYILNTTELQYPEKNYSIEFDFYSDSTTNLDENFTAKNLDSNGC
ncbi:flagellar basal body FlgE domain-containing protein [Cognaticolwellia mytili]|uniref:flagellar basal body FlgE domain-containing protein n=1 Tax=Cognaticolwellia mytili TaxID=1888913 RepID=UPI000A173549|nr:flagellar basal body FlgE domain-containing protein [Cognaticolwellia mytili]